MDKVVERPAIFPPSGDLNAWANSLTQAVVAALMAHGYRLNRMLPADASEAISLTEYADDTAAASGGVAVGGLYRTGSVVKVRVS